MSEEPQTEGGGPVESPPLLRVVRGDPTPEELAALVAVVAAASAGGGEAPASVRSRRSEWSEWSAPHRRLRHPLRHGPGAWLASARPVR